MREFDYIIIGGGCAGLSLAYELETHNKLKNKTLAIIEPRLEYKEIKLGLSGKQQIIILKIALKKVGIVFL